MSFRVDTRGRAGTASPPQLQVFWSFLDFSTEEALDPTTDSIRQQYTVSKGIRLSFRTDTEDSVSRRAVAGMAGWGGAGGDC